VDDFLKTIQTVVWAMSLLPGNQAIGQKLNELIQGTRQSAGQVAGGAVMGLLRQLHKEEAIHAKALEHYLETLSTITAKDEERIKKREREAQEEPVMPDPEELVKKMDIGKVKDLEFQVINLRRFALEGPGGLAREPEQKTEDKGTHSRLDNIAGILNNKSQTAVLG